MGGGQFIEIWFHVAQALHFDRRQFIARRPVSSNARPIREFYNHFHLHKRWPPPEKIEEFQRSTGEKGRSGPTGPAQTFPSNRYGATKILTAVKKGIGCLGFLGRPGPDPIMSISRRLRNRDSQPDSAMKMAGTHSLRILEPGKEGAGEEFEKRFWN